MTAGNHRDTIMGTIRDRIVRYVERLRFPYLVAATAVLFVVNMAIPDVIPYIDEILLGLATVILSRIKKHVTASDAPEPSERHP
jgi:hypothetical protein